MEKKRPLLSIGIIFKNEIRCLERCLKSLQPLRDAVPCEVVMADTGSDDGSRAVAEKYADILINFPWINDFAAARNAVIDRCSGKWYMTMDADEWLDEDISQFVEFLNDTSAEEGFGTLVVRNYASYDFNGSYSDFLAMRIVRRSIGARYEGAIHEAWNTKAGSIRVLNKTILHHDGYVGMGTDQGLKKRARNMSLLREELRKSPNDLRRMLQCLESSGGDSDHEEYVRMAVEGTKKKLSGWKMFGPAIFRGAVAWAAGQETEELDAFVEDARTLFPDSMYTRLDIEYLACSAYFQLQNYEKAIISGEAYLQAMDDYHTGRCNLTDMLYSTVGSVSPLMENHARLALAECYFQVKDFQKSVQRITSLEFDKLEFSDFKNCVGIMLNLHAQGGIDLSSNMLFLWNYLDGLDKTDPMSVQKVSSLVAAGATVFPPNYRKAETEQGFQHAYTVFLPLAGKFEMGTAAQILETTDKDELEALLTTVKNWNEFPIHALAHAIRCGVCFPLRDNPLQIEKMDAFSARLAWDADSAYLLVEKIMEQGVPSNVQELAWARALVLMALQKFDWTGENVDSEKGLLLTQAFVKVEKEYLPLCYTSKAMQEENLFLLPAMHRFGYYCVQAFEALEHKNAVETVRLLRKGLDVCESMKDMVEFLLNQIPELQTPPPLSELLTLAEQIRGVLANFAPDDPAVAALKQSEAYQSVAHLIEGAPAVGWGGLAQ